jgi:hypothetical protein
MRWFLILLCVLPLCGCAMTQTHINVYSPAQGDRPEISVGVTFDNWRR